MCARVRSTRMVAGFFNEHFIIAFVVIAIISLKHLLGLIFPAGLKKLFDVDLKNLKKLAELLDKFDPKADGADRDWVSIYEESERLLYLEIDYLNEADNAVRFARDFMDVPWVRVPEVYREVTTPRVLTMEFVESFKLTNLDQIDRLGLDRDLLSKRTADAFLKQIIETGYFHVSTTVWLFTLLCVLLCSKNF